MTMPRAVGRIRRTRIHSKFLIHIKQCVKNYRSRRFEEKLPRKRAAAGNRGHFRRVSSFAMVCADLPAPWRPDVATKFEYDDEESRKTERSALAPEAEAIEPLSKEPESEQKPN